MDGWVDRIAALRNRIVGNPAFQRWASAFPLTRPVANRQSRALFDLCAGFVYSQVLLAVTRLKVLEMVGDRPATSEELAPRIGLSVEACERLLAAARSLRLLERRRDGRYGLGMLGAALLGNPSLAAMIEHHALLYRDLQDPVALLRGERRGELQAYWSYAGTSAPADLSAAAVAGYSTLMSASQELVADDVLDAYPLDRHRTLLDVGGGDGTFLIAAAARAAHLQLRLFDLPPVVERARERLTAAGFSQRAQFSSGDFFTSSLPGDADVATLVRILLDHDDASALRLLENVRSALPPGGVLLVAEPMSDPAGAEPVGDAYFGFYLLAMGRGRARTPAALSELMKKAGFTGISSVSTRRPLLTRMLKGCAPSA